MSDDQITYFICPSGHMNEELRRIEHDDGSGEWLCNTCDHRFGIWLNGGELDLGPIAITTYRPGEQPPIAFIDEEFTEVVDGSGWTQGGPI